MTVFVPHYAMSGGTLIALGAGSVQELVTRTQTPDKAKELAALLATGAWTHDDPITMEEGRRLGLNVSSAMPPDFLRPKPSDR